MFSKHCATTASKPWSEPHVSIEVANNICYAPITYDKIKAIKIEETEDILIDLSKEENPRIIPLVSFDNKYSSGHKEYGKIRKDFYHQLIIMLQHLPPNVGIAYFEGLRPLIKQKEYFDKKFLEVLNELQDLNLAYAETCKHVSPFIDNIPVHATGAALDLTLFIDSNGEKALLDLGQFGTIFGPNYHQETFSSSTTMVQRQNRLMLLNAAVSANLCNYGYEWWHFHYKDRAWAYVKGEDKASYGLASSTVLDASFSNKEDYLNAMQSHLNSASVEKSISLI